MNLSTTGKAWYKMQGLLIILCAAAMALWPAGCAVRPPSPPADRPVETALKRLSPPDYPHFSDDGEMAPLQTSIRMSLQYLKRLPADRQIDFGADGYSVSHVMHSLEIFSNIIAQNPSTEELNRTIRNHFYVYQSVGQTKEMDVLFTGYYEPLLMAGIFQTPEFGTPVHTKPSDMVEIDLSPFADDLKGRKIVGQYTGNTVVPYPTRKGIRDKVDFNSTAPPIVWLRDEIDLLILQIQGSGRVQLPDGTEMHILYDGSNGRPYRSIGRRLINEGRISPEQMSMQAIRAYLRKHPESAQEIIDHNPRYIFFKTGHQGPVGALGRPLTPMRSVAVDRTLLPSAALAFITLPLPKLDIRGNIQRWLPHRGFVLAQDAGSAITGPGRIDLFTGHGLRAEMIAGHLKHPGTLHFLILKHESSHTAP
jgi:membrane-bound lytic murein transglycosylase A